MLANNKPSGGIYLQFPRLNLVVSVFAFVPSDDPSCRFMDSCLEIWIKWGRWSKVFHIRTENKRGIRLPDEAPATYTH